MKVLLMLAGVFGGSFVGSLIGRFFGINGIYTILGSIVGAFGMYWVWRKYVDDDDIASTLDEEATLEHSSSARTELLHEMMEERRRARIGRHRRNDKGNILMVLGSGNTFRCSIRNDVDDINLNKVWR